MIPRGHCTAPALRGHPLLKNLIQFRRDQIDTLERAYRECGPVSQLTLAYERLVFVNDPALIRHVLVDNAKAYSRSDNFESRWLRVFLGDGLLTTDGDVWRRLRRASQPAFTKEAVARVQDRIAKETAVVLDEWNRTVAHGQPIDLFPELLALTCRVAYQAFFGLDLAAADAAKMTTGLIAGQEFVIRRIKIPSKLLANLPTPWNREFRRGMAIIDGLIGAAIRDRAARPAREADDMLGMLLASSVAGDARELRDQVVTNFAAAPENTATALTWTLYLLSRHPEVARDVRRELQAGGPSTLLRRVLLETLRLYPGAPNLDRRAIEDDVIGGFEIPRGSLVMISPYILHRSERFWNRPNEFDPSRFEDPDLQSSPAYIPFGRGARRCIGDRFALTLLETALPMLLERFDIIRTEREPLGIAPLINLRPRGGFKVRVQRRPAAERVLQQSA